MENVFREIILNLLADIYVCVTGELFLIHYSRVRFTKLILDSKCPKLLKKSKVWPICEKIYEKCNN